MEDERPNPDELLSAVMRQEQAEHRGRLSVFLGMCPGVGKTYAMLRAARQQQKAGVRVFVGVVETHGRVETQEMLKDLEVLPRKALEHRGHVLEEFDLDEVLARKPELVLVDELAHTNATGSRHAKRYQDVLELLEAGIDVYTTVNVQHIESQVDLVKRITGVTVAEKVPDSFLDHADEVELIDVSVEKLLERLSAGKVYLGERAQLAKQNFFLPDHLTALREMALRFTAEYVDRGLEGMRKLRRKGDAWNTTARLLVGIGPSPYAESLIRWTRRAAARLGCQWIVVRVEGFSRLTEEEERRLASSLALARRLGAELVTVGGEDVAAALLRVARERNVTQIVVGKPGVKHFWKKSLADRVIEASGEIDVCVVRPVLKTQGPVEKKPRRERFEASGKEYGLAVVISLGLAGVGWVAKHFAGYPFVGLLFLFVIVLCALRLKRGPILLLAALSALLWNFLFIEPAFTLYISKPQDVALFAMFFFVALSMGHLTTRLRQREMAEMQRERHTAALLRVTQSAALTAGSERGLEEALTIIREMLGAEVALVVRLPDHQLPELVHAASTFLPSAKEWGVVHWAYQNRKAAGRFTDTLPAAEAIWLPLQTATSVMGVFGVKYDRAEVLPFSTRQAIEGFALQLALVLEKEHFVAAISQAEILAQSERLQRTLLDSLSHELKTPIAVIQAALDGMNLPENPYCQEISMASQRLQRVVKNLLQMTRLEATNLKPHWEWCFAGELIEQARELAGGDFSRREVRIEMDEEIPAVKLDVHLCAQALANVLHNAAIYAPEGTPIEIACGISREKKLVLSVKDSGVGLPVGEEEKVFEKFYRAPGSPTGGTGLGLSIARTLVRALGGEMDARNREAGGAEFRILIPVEILDA